LETADTEIILPERSIHGPLGLNLLAHEEQTATNALTESERRDR
jgi:hypothetical protein